jgi:sec-independent protein translocase protein TatA
MPFNLGPLEMVFVLVVLLLVFGAKRLPELGSGLGKGIREFRRTMRDVNDEISREAPQNRISEPTVRAQVPPSGDSDS